MGTISLTKSRHPATSAQETKAEAIPEIIQYSESESETIQENESTPETIPDSESTPESVPESESTPETIPESESTPESVLPPSSGLCPPSPDPRPLNPAPYPSSPDPCPLKPDTFPPSPDPLRSAGRASVPERKDEQVILDWLELAVKDGVSDIFIGAGRHITFKKNGVIIPQDTENLKPGDSERLISDMYSMAHRSMTKYLETGDDDFPVTVPGLARFRINTYRQRSTMAAIIRVVSFDMPDYKKLLIPDGVMRIAEENRGLVLVTGPAGSGKTTTLACIIDAINKARNCHIITLEDPIEYLHRDNKSLVSQREISTDTDSYSVALRACLRQAPDIILLGEMRDHETIRTAMTAAETGHLVISTLHTIGAANTIDRIIDTFPPEQQQQIRVQLSMVLRMVVTQKLLPNTEGKSIPAFEIMRVNNAISNLIRESKIHQIDNVIQTSAQEGMVGMDAYITTLYRNGEITAETALHNAINAETMQRQLGV